MSNPTSTPTAASLEELAAREGVNCNTRLNSYYFDFEPTGVAEIDLILGAVCYAGKMYHSTEGWSDPWHDDGPSEIENIQKAALVAARALRSIQGQDRATPSGIRRMKA